jgi:two-component system, cell cycle sensor histidine kinase and response regulator CckA
VARIGGTRRLRTLVISVQPLVAATGVPLMSAPNPSELSDRSDRWRWLVVVLVAVVAVVVGLWLADREERADLDRAYATGHAICTRALGNIARWREERLATGRLFARSPAVVSAVDRWLRAPGDPEPRATVMGFLALLRGDAASVEAALVGLDADVLLSASGQPFPLGPESQRAVQEAVSRGEAVTTGLYPAASAIAGRFDVVAPVPGLHGQTVAVLVVRSAPEATLFPLLRQWPGPARSLDNVFVMRDGDRAFLLDVERARITSVSASELRGPLVRAAAREAGRYDGIDERAVPELADVQPIPRSRWTVVSRIDCTAALEDTRRRRVETGLIGVLGFLLAGAAVHASGRRRERNAYRTLYEAEVRQRAITAHYESVIRWAPDIILLTDADGRIVVANHQAEMAYGRDMAELCTLTLDDLRAPGSEPPPQAVGDGARGEAPLVYETVHRRKDDTVFPVESSTMGITIDERRFVHAIVRDISERRRAEAERERMQEQLANAERIEAIGRLAGGIAHDFNNLLTVINNYADLAVGALHEDDPVHADCSHILAAGRRAAKLTAQLLAFSRKQVLQPDVLRLSDVVSGLEAMIGRLVGEDLILECRHADDLWPVEADRGQVERVIMNLLVNARDAMPDGGRVTIQTANVVLDEEWAAAHAGGRVGPHVMLCVSDTGVGMDQDTLSHVFDPFFTTKPQGKGTGLGLAMAYGVVKQSGGSVYVCSEVGRGTTFRIYLPACADGAVGPHEEATGAEAAGTERILVVEDDESVRELARRILERAGYRVVTAESGPDALRWCEGVKDAPDLILTDIVMPQMSGPQMVAVAQYRWPRVRVLYMSGHAGDAIDAQGVSAAEVEFIAKPFTAAELSAKVRHVLDDGPSVRA